MAAALKCKREFAAFGHPYVPGATIPQEHYLKWPEGTLKNRLDGEDVAWESVEDAPPAKPK
jgi:hypothetical protein